MALKEAFAIKTVIGDTDLELRADPGEAFLIRDIFVKQTDFTTRADQYATLKTEKTTVGFFRVRGTFGGHLGKSRGKATHNHTFWVKDAVDIVSPKFHQIYKPAGDAPEKTYPFYLVSNNAPGNWLKDFVQQQSTSDQTQKSILNYLWAQGIFKGYPVAEGETFRIQTEKKSVGWEENVKFVIYDIYEPSDIKPDQENGSRAKEYMFINYGDCGASIQLSIDNIYDNSMNPAEFPNFPFGAVVPAKHEITVYGIMGTEFAPHNNTATDYSATRFLKMIKDREVLLDEDRNGLPFFIPWLLNESGINEFGEGVSMLGNYSSGDRREPFMFPEPLVFSPGDEYGIYVTLRVGGTGQVITQDQHEIALIEKIRRID